MELPYSLLRAIEDLASGCTVSDLQKAAQRLSERYRDSKRSGQPLLSDRLEAAAYAITRMPATYGAVYSALNWALEHSPCRPLSLLDVGAGTGAGSWAAAQVLELEKITCIEKEKSMKEQGLALMKTTDLQKAAWLSGDVTCGSLDYHADLVIASYMLNEVSPEQRPAAVKALWEAADQLLLIVEPGTPAGFAELRSIREQLLSLGAHMVAPCPHANICPIGGEDWCHFTCRVPRSRLHRQLKGGEVPYEDEKFTYLVVSKEEAEPCTARVLRHPLIETGRVTLELCDRCGKHKTTLRKKDTGYKQARKMDCGDSFVVVND